MVFLEIQGERWISTTGPLAREDIILFRYLGRNYKARITKILVSKIGYHKAGYKFRAQVLERDGVEADEILILEEDILQDGILRRVWESESSRWRVLREPPEETYIEV